MALKLQAGKRYVRRDGQVTGPLERNAIGDCQIVVNINESIEIGLKHMKKIPLTIVTMAQLRSFGPCYDPIKHLPEGFAGTVLDILRHKDIPPVDKIWTVCREEFLSASLLRRFAVAQAKTCRKQVRGVAAKKEFDRILRVCTRFASGKATQDELSAAESAAESAARSAAESAAESAARSAARSAAWSAARSAGYSAAESAATAAHFAVHFAARSAAWSAAESAARSAARAAAYSAARSAACRMLLRMVLKECVAPKRVKASKGGKA